MREVLFDIAVHDGIVHLASNLLVLVICWRTLAGALGRLRTVFVLGLAGCVAIAISAWLSGRPVIGSSGAAAAALAATVALRPAGRVMSMSLPSIAIFLPWLASQCLFASLGPTFAGIAWPAHLIGAALGAAGAHLLRRRCIPPT